ncbi:MAG: hypothetical protein KIT44_06550 [Opitutaceae bacterium]|nr:hypothetical protein [Opitutaceae bacterium]
MKIPIYAYTEHGLLWVCDMEENRIRQELITLQQGNPQWHYHAWHRSNKTITPRHPAFYTRNQFKDESQKNRTPDHKAPRPSHCQRSGGQALPFRLRAAEQALEEGAREIPLAAHRPEHPCQGGTGEGVTTTT